MWERSSSKLPLKLQKHTGVTLRGNCVLQSHIYSLLWEKVKGQVDIFSILTGKNNKKREMCFTFRETFFPKVTSPDTVRWSSSNMSGMFSNLARNSWTCRTENIIRHFKKMHFVHFHSDFRTLMLDVNSLFKLNNNSHHSVVVTCDSHFRFKHKVEMNDILMFPFLTNVWSSFISC